ncbi:MAG TPA: alpha-amylase family glycosyl hydrolase [Puia sp.]|nr:alpha-amylase family glycosyl hydrolase [Puia sp.]
MNSDFQPVDWSYNANIYEVNLRQYTTEGSFNAFGKELPRLRDMGIEILWFMPVTPISVVRRIGSLGSYYSCSDYTACNPEYGTVADFRNLVRNAHGLGFKVLIDWVANHTGWDHRWTREHPDFYKKNASGNFFDSNGWEDVIDLDYSNVNLRNAMVESMSFWVRECDIDGFRCDMAMLVPLDFWKEARTKLDGQKKLFWLAECEDIPYQEAFDAIYTWKFLHAMEAYWRKEMDMAGLYSILQYYEQEFKSTTFRLFFTTNHDENSHSGSEYERMGDAAKAFQVLCCTWNGLPLIYSGQELPNLKRLDFFNKDPIAWSGKYELHDFYKTLLRIRKNNPAMRAGTLANISVLPAGEGNKVFCFLRKQEKNEVLVAINLSEKNISFVPDNNIVSGEFRNSLTSELHQFERESAIRLSPWGFRIFER